MAGKYDPEVAKQCLEYVKAMINANLGPGESAVDFDTSGSQDNLAAVLKDGTLLARFGNALIPGSIAKKKYEKPSSMPFKNMELIGLFLDVVRNYGINDEESFVTIDLFERQNLHQVTICFQAIGRKAPSKGQMGFGSA